MKSTSGKLRNASLKGLLEIVIVLNKQKDEALLDLLTRRTMVARYDMLEENSKLAERYIAGGGYDEEKKHGFMSFVSPPR